MRMRVCLLRHNASMCARTEWKAKPRAPSTAHDVSADQSAGEWRHFGCKTVALVLVFVGELAAEKIFSVADGQVCLAACPFLQL